MHLYSKSKHVLGVTPVTELAGAGRRVKVSCTWHLDPCSHTWMCTEVGFSTLAPWPFGAEQHLAVFCASSDIYKTPVDITNDDRGQNRRYRETQSAYLHSKSFPD